MRIFHKECKSLARAGYQVTLVAQAPHDGEHDGIALRALPIWKSRLQRFARGAFAVYRKALEADADVYHFHDPELIPVGLLLRMRGKKVIYDSHEDTPRTISYKPYIPSALCGTVSHSVGFLENLACRWFSALVTATSGMADRFRRLNGNIVVINNYPRIDEIESSASPNARADAEPSFLYVGMRITRARGAEEMVRAMGLLPMETRARLRLVGNWDSSELPASLTKIPGWDRVTFVGLVGRPEVASELQNAAAGLVILHPEPNYVTSQPVKLFEYMCAGLPVIVSDFPSCREIVNDARCGILVDPLNPKEIAGAMEFLLTHPEEAAAMGRRGYAAVRERYTWANEEKTLLRLYSELFRHDAAYEGNVLRRGQTA
ncbi:MAG TPA: glycosyltransferase family 4 protein [Candidatus Acidoferrales bacterium]|nr:glycosyltransferase family 4 protein [Candidatus Acidoferrales bacterium]